ncbi:(2fe-2s)-binding protein [Nannochloropsis oceanica]
MAPLQMGFFDSIKKGFENEAQVQPAPNAGLKNGPPIVTITFLPANKKVQAVAGQNLKDVALAAKIPIKYNCKKGECGTCEIDLNGKKVRTCVGIVPRGARKNEVTIKVLK